MLYNTEIVSSFYTQLFISIRLKTIKRMFRVSRANVILTQVNIHVQIHKEFWHIRDRYCLLCKVDKSTRGWWRCTTNIIRTSQTVGYSPHRFDQLMQQILKFLQAVLQQTSAVNVIDQRKNYDKY